MLKYFQKAYFNPKQTIVFSFTLVPEDFSFIGLDNKPVIEPGEFILSSADLGVVVMVTGKTTHLSDLQDTIM